MGAVTSLFVRKVVRAAAADGARAGLLRSVGLDPDAETDVSQMIADTAYYALLERIAAGDDPSDLPLRVGATMRADDYGAFGLAWKTAPTLRDSFARSERYWRLLTSVSEYEVRPEGDDAYFILHRGGERRLGLRLSNEATLASVLSMVREVATAPITPLEVHLKHPAPASTAPHQAYFGCPVMFGSSLDALLFSGAALGRPNRQADEGITRFLLRHLDQALAEIGGEPSMDDSVSRAVSQALSAGVPKAADIARQLGLSERTLQRRLQAEGLSFQKLVDTARRDLAKGLLRRTDYPLAEVAFLTGFSEQSAFTRAFRRWEDRTPAAYRQDHAA